MVRHNIVVCSDPIPLTLNLLQVDTQSLAGSALSARQDSRTRCDPESESDETSGFESDGNIYKFRTKMADFGENFHGGGGPVVCPLCWNHLDSQSFSLQCSEMRGLIHTDRTIEDVYGDHVDEETAHMTTEILRIREELKD